MRTFRLRAGLGGGYFKPRDVNDYIKSKLPKNATSVKGFSSMVLLLSTEVSLGYYPIPYFGVRATATYLFAPKVIEVQGGDSDLFWLHALAPGLSLDVGYDSLDSWRLFLSPGLAYHWAWLDRYSAGGIGYTLAGGADFAIGQSKDSRTYVAGVLRIAKLPVNNPSASSGVTTHQLDFTSFLLCLGFQLDI